ncbi:SRPBCC family protein [Zavarzinia compransoris]|uniref:SRPBCC family protein n=1 Tax=Zavarzinia marina TaxID=2911065 RepID=UPI001F382AE9|nr:SRPBCC family protein [Zavarzinia marina]MCF4166252.1 SRPBCC family protein [Zavarzinia marina]
MTATGERSLVLDRLLRAPRAAIFRCLTEPALLSRWFAPHPHTITRAELDVAPGGAAFIVMKLEGGEEMPLHFTYLEVVRDQKLVFTDAFTSAWEPSAKAFMAVTITLDDEGASTRYVARAAHWTAEDRKAHEDMGFHEGWGLCASQLEVLAAGL